LFETLALHVNILVALFARLVRRHYMSPRCIITIRLYQTCWK